MRLPTPFDRFEPVEFGPKNVPEFASAMAHIHPSIGGRKCVSLKLRSNDFCPYSNNTNIYLLGFESSRWRLITRIRFGDVGQRLLGMNSWPAHPEAVALDDHRCDRRY